MLSLSPAAERHLSPPSQTPTGGFEPKCFPNTKWGDIFWKNSVSSLQYIEGVWGRLRRAVTGKVINTAGTHCLIIVFKTSRDSHTHQERTDQHPSMFHKCLSLSGGWSQSQLTLGERRGTPWKSLHFITGLTNKHSHSHSHLWAI